MIEQGIFPISEKEAALLHDLGWASGYGWKSEWDWWRKATEEVEGVEAAMDSRDLEEVRFLLVTHVIFIREAHAFAEKLLIEAVLGGQQQAVSQKEEPIGPLRLDGKPIGSP